MYQIVRSRTFERSYRRLKKSGTLKESVRDDLTYAIDLLVAGEALPATYRDHQLKGDYRAYRECHIRGDLLLIYQLSDEYVTLILVDIGSHSYLFG